MEHTRTRIRVFGAIEGVPVGTRFQKLSQLDESKIHFKRQKRMSFAKKGVASVLIISKDIDKGDVIRLIQDFSFCHKKENNQVRPDSLKYLSDAFERNLKEGIPIRIVRSATVGGQYAPLFGYRYDGLYKVTNISETVGLYGGTWQCDLQLLPGQPIFWERPPPMES